MRHYKWAYNLAEHDLHIWEVDGAASWASPQHGDKLSNDEYASLYQGRLSVSDCEITSFTIYSERPFVDRTDEGAKEAEDAVRNWVKDLLDGDNSL